MVHSSSEQRRLRTRDDNRVVRGAAQVLQGLGPERRGCEVDVCLALGDGVFLRLVVYGL